MRLARSLPRFNSRAAREALKQLELFFAVDFVTVQGLLIYIIWASVGSFPATLIGRRWGGMRIPKEGSAVSAGRNPQ